MTLLCVYFHDLFPIIESLLLQKFSPPLKMQFLTEDLFASKRWTNNHLRLIANFTRKTLFRPFNIITKFYAKKVIKSDKFQKCRLAFFTRIYYGIHCWKCIAPWIKIFGPQFIRKCCLLRALIDLTKSKQFSNVKERESVDEAEKYGTFRKQLLFIFPLYFFVDAKQVGGALTERAASPTRTCFA